MWCLKTIKHRNLIVHFRLAFINIAGSFLLFSENGVLILPSIDSAATGRLKTTCRFRHPLFFYIHYGLREKLFIFKFYGDKSLQCFFMIFINFYNFCCVFVNIYFCRYTIYWFCTPLKIWKITSVPLRSPQTVGRKAIRTLERSLIICTD